MIESTSHKTKSCHEGSKKVSQNDWLLFSWLFCLTGNSDGTGRTRYKNMPERDPFRHLVTGNTQHGSRPRHKERTKVEDIREMLKKVAAGELSVDNAVLELKKEPFTAAGYDDLGFAKLDTHRKLRQGAAEVIYGAGKTPEQIAGIVEAMKKRGQETILITRVDEEKSRETEQLLAELYPTGSGYQYFKEAKVAICGSFPEKDGVGTIVVATGGTSDIPVAEEAALTAESLGNQVERLYDVGVAGLHRLMSHMDSIMNARVIIAIAGMEGALASVIGGLADCPVIAVPTSIGYGASFGGVSALLSMLNSCASGVSVVNIDNGFGAGYLASMMNHMRG